MGRLFGRSLRASVLFAVVAVVLSPLAFVLLSNGLEAVSAERTFQRTVDDATALAAAIRQSKDPAQLAALVAVASHRRQRVRVLGPQGELLAGVDSMTTDDSAFTLLGDLFYGPHRRTVLEALSNAKAPALRPDVRAALQQGEHTGCEHSTAGNLDYCATALRIDDTGRVVLVEGMSRRALQALYESRRQLVKLTLVVLGVGLVLWWWLGLRIVRPILALREEVMVRAAAAAPHADIDLRRRDELGDLAGSFNALLRALAERDRANEVFLADLAHEFKNPIAAVRAAADQVVSVGADDVGRRRLAEVLTTSAVRLDAMVTQFLELARAESGLPNEARESVDVVALLRGLTDALKQDARYAGLKVELACPAEPSAVRGVPQRLESAFRNLLDNAASFAGAGGTVRVSAKVEGEVIEIAIGDSGPGIPEADLKHLFERFFTTRGDRHGTGLGLALTRAVVEAHGGQIRAESPPGSGARFIIRLPLR